jgi:DNA polymerase III delta subunit
MIYFIHGPDRLLARQAAAAIVHDVDPDEVNTSWFDGRETSYARIAAAVGSAGFFGAVRVVVVTDLLAKSGATTVSSDSDDAAGERPASNALATLVSAVPAENVLVLVEPSLVGPPAALKSLPARVVAAEPPRGPALVKWIDGAAQGLGAHIEPRAAQALAQALYPQTWDRKPPNPRYDRPPDMTLLTHEIEKLALAAHPGSISQDHVRALTSGGPDDRLFRFVDAAVGGNVQPALAELERLIDAGVEPAMILAQTLGQIELIAVAGEAASGAAAGVSRDLSSVSASRLSAVLNAARRLHSHHGRSLVTGAVDVDRRLKSGRTRQPLDALHDLVLGLAVAGAEREPGHSW